MRNDSLRRISKVGCAALLFTFCAFAEQHKWAGRMLDDFEWRIHETLASLPHSVRMNVYRAVYDQQPLEKYGARATPPVHIIVKDGWVTLDGVVDSDADRSTVHFEALKVTAHVSNNLRVAVEEHE
jgi:osmotically-inducible protein OsmY